VAKRHAGIYCSLGSKQAGSIFASSLYFQENSSKYMSLKKASGACFVQFSGNLLHNWFATQR
jgi:hypothetical protein